MNSFYQLLKKGKTRSATVHQSIKSLRESEEFSEIIERLSMTFTANGNRQGRPCDQFFPPFFTFAVCSLPFSTRREVISRR